MNKVERISDLKDHIRSSNMSASDRRRALIALSRAERLLELASAASSGFRRILRRVLRQSARDGGEERRNNDSTHSVERPLASRNAAPELCNTGSCA
jgi:hypothetical protein